MDRKNLSLQWKYRQARLIINRSIQTIIDQELTETVVMRTERKRTSLIASLVSSLQQNEKIEGEKIRRKARYHLSVIIKYRI